MLIFTVCKPYFSTRNKMKNANRKYYKINFHRQNK